VFRPTIRRLHIHKQFEKHIEVKRTDSLIILGRDIPVVFFQI